MENRTSLIRQHFRMNLTLTNIIDRLDFVRAGILKLMLRNSYFRIVFLTRQTRIFLNFFLILSSSMIFAVYRPDLLLMFGPFVYGYFHLISSYKYSLSINFSSISNHKFILYFLFLITLLELISRLLIHHYKDIILLPNGFIALVLTFLFFTFIAVKYGSRKKAHYFIFSALLFSSLIGFSWNNPLNFVAFNLHLHNLVAFLYWIKVSKNFKSSLNSVSCTACFLILNLLILKGVFDKPLALFEESFILESNYKNYSWLLAPWSNKPIVWRRALCVYTFGLSMHYFVWLKAIPENLYKNRTPVSFKKSYTSLRDYWGKATTKLILAISFVGFFIWIFNFSLGAKIYFLISNIHIWTEVVLLSFSFLILNKEKK